MKQLQQFFDLSFNNPALLETALTHSSYANENNCESNERLEFIGDAVLDVMMGKYLYEKYPDYNEGNLTKLRAKNVCESALVEYAKACQLNEYLRLGKGEEKSGGRQRTALQADAFEALIGAVYMDKGLTECYKIFNHVVIPLVEEDRSDDFVDYKSYLQELVQSDKRTLEYRIVNEYGPSHDKTFVTRVYMDQILMGEGEGKTKKEAEQKAAEMALKKLAIRSIKF
ncbi:ribonuclease III [Candidatus Xianfuyuplasma coldseepsis]|uniref:Ribonuclease 3 n=1 Tax=Candidatus Xianfuyuplasma coldseepsis TaxID=2782163 RepID=A0A7L7KUZ0_9MOLU|nr:ribonuclease III [Xianfuyuplasma coldseepsis]QMS85588.1 ribonuclease III [Xianfuyuplasma coldseepsis]